MKDQNLRVGIALAAAVVAGAMLGGCTTTSTASERAAAKTASNKPLRADELGAITPVSEAALAAAMTDNFWENELDVSTDKEGQLTYSSKGSIVDDPTYNRQELRSFDPKLTGRQAAHSDTQLLQIWSMREGMYGTRQLRNSTLTLQTPSTQSRQVVHPPPAAPRPQSAPQPRWPEPSNDQ